MIYFDSAATTKPYKEVLETFNKLNDELFANPASSHLFGSKANTYLEKARNQISSLLGLNDRFNLYFTSGATESNNQAILGYCRRHKKEGNKVITSSLEHPSVTNAFKELEKEGFEVIYLNSSKEGTISLNELENALDNKTIFVSVMGVNNEVGSIFPYREIYKLVHSKSKAVFMSDLTQMIGKEKVDFNYIDMFSMSSHKVGGLKSLGLLGVVKGINIDQIIYGGEQEGGFRPGTVNMPLACSLATALRINLFSLDERRKRAKDINDYLRSKLDNNPLFEIASPLGGTPFILNIILKHTKASVLVEALSKREVYVSTRSACSSHSEGGSSVILNMGYSEFDSKNAIRLSFNGLEQKGVEQEFIKIFFEEIGKIKSI